MITTTRPTTSMDVLVQHIEKASLNKKLELLHFRFNQEQFNCLYLFLKTNPDLSHIKVSKNLLTTDQITKLLVIVNSNLMKGVKLLDENNKAFGHIYTNWNSYYLDKIKITFEISQTTLIALEHFDNPPQLIIDFGAGTGQKTNALLQRQCPSIVAIEADAEAIKILKSKNSDFIEEQRLQVYEGPFLKYDIKEPANLFIAEFSWPYRPPTDFEDCWHKTIACVIAGGWIAGQLFGAPEEKDPGMTYHTKDQALNLLEDNFEQVTIREELPSECKIYGGKEPPWGILYHIIARKKIRHE